MAKNETWRRSQLTEVRVRVTEVRGKGIGITTHVYGLSGGDGNEDASGQRSPRQAQANWLMRELLNPPSIYED